MTAGKMNARQFVRRQVNYGTERATLHESRKGCPSVAIGMENRALLAPVSKCRHERRDRRLRCTKRSDPNGRVCDAGASLPTRAAETRGQRRRVFQNLAQRGVQAADVHQGRHQDDR